MPSYRLGRLPGQVPVGLRDLTYYAAGPLPKAPASVAVPAVADWLLLANGPDPTCPEYPQGVGDCGVAGLEHGFMSAAADTSERETFPDAERAVSYYFGYTGGQDSGVVLSQYLAHVRQNGYYGHTVGAYAPVAVHDVPTLQFTINAYDFAYVGITVTQGMMDAADGPAPWTWTAESVQGQPLGGHCIILVAYDSNWLYGVSWGQLVRIAYPAWHQMGDEAWAVIVGEDDGAEGDGHGISLAALQADLPRLDGAAAEPAVPPVDHKGLLEEAAELIRAVASSAKKDTTELLAFLASHGL